MAERFEGKIALVTGGSRGIGRSIVEALVKEGAIVYALGKSQEHLDKLKRDIPNVNILQADVTDWDATKSIVKEIGVVDLLVNNAGIARPYTNFVDVDKQMLEDVLDTNFKSAFNISQVVVCGLITAGRPGVIVNMSSVAGLKSSTGYSSYCISKAMMDMMTKTMALELGPHKIRVNSLNPTLVPTDMARGLLNISEFIGPISQMHPLGKIAELRDVVEAALFLLSDKASTITGSCLPIDSGFLLL